MEEIKINGTSVNAICKDYRCKNILTYAEEIELLNDFTIDNESIDSAYMPKVDFTFSKVSIVEYQWLIENVNKKSFNVTYYDYTLGKTVTRNMRLENDDIERLYFVGNNLDSILGLTVTFVCRRGYFNYEDL